MRNINAKWILLAITIGLLIAWFGKSREPILLPSDLIGAKYVELSNYESLEFVTDDPVAVSKVKELELSKLESFEKGELKNGNIPYPTLVLYTALDSPKWKRIGRRLRFDPDLVSTGKYGKDFKQLIDSIVEKDDDWIIFMSMKPDGATEKEILEYKKNRKRK